MVLRTVRWGGWTATQQIRWFSRWPCGRLDHFNGGQRHSRVELENNSREPRDLTKNRHSDSLKKSQLTLSQGMMRKGDVIVVADDDDDDDNEVRTSASQNYATAPVCTEELFLRTQYI
jgi:hypothetical protein